MFKLRNIIMGFSVLCLVSAIAFAGWSFWRYRATLANWGDNYFKQTPTRNNANALESYYVQRYAGTIESTQIDVQKQSNLLILSNYDLQNKLGADAKLQLQLPNHYLEKQLSFMQFDKQTAEPLKTETFTQLGDKLAADNQVQVEIAQPLFNTLTKPFIFSLVVYEFL